MLRLTRQERNVLCAILFLLLTGWVVQVWRAAHPPEPAVEMVESTLNAHR